MQHGAFIIRFSTSSIRSIAISYKDTQRVNHIKARLLSPQSHKFAFNLTNASVAEYSLAEFVQKYKKLKQLYDWHNNALQPKVDVYFGKGKAANVHSPPHKGQHQQYHNNMHQHQQQSSDHSMYRS